jgi:hypothetical protein
MKCPTCGKLYTDEDIAKDEGKMKPWEEDLAREISMRLHSKTLSEGGALDILGRIVQHIEGK